VNSNTGIKIENESSSLAIRARKSIFKKEANMLILKYGRKWKRSGSITGALSLCGLRNLNQIHQWARIMLDLLGLQIKVEKKNKRMETKKRIKKVPA
jgi:hypothetical protein